MLVRAFQTLSVPLNLFQGDKLDSQHWSNFTCGLPRQRLKSASSKPTLQQCARPLQDRRDDLDVNVMETCPVDMSPVAKDWMDNPPKDVACPDDPPKRFADFPKRLGSTATWELYPSPPAPEQEPPKDPIPEPLPELPEEPKSVAPEQLEEVETKGVITEDPQRDLFHPTDQVTRAEQMEHRKKANIEVEEEDGEAEKSEKKKKGNLE